MGKIDEWTEKIKQIDGETLDPWDFKQNYFKKFQDCLKDVGADDWKEVQDFILQCIECGNNDVMCCANEIISKRNIIKWKDHPEVMTAILEQVYKYGQLPASTRKHYHENAFRPFMEKFIKLLKSCRLFKNYIDRFYDILITTFTSNDNRLHSFMTYYTEEIKWTKHTDWALCIFDIVYGVVQKYPDMSKEDPLASSACRIMYEIYIDCYNNVKYAVKYIEKTTAIFYCCMGHKWMDPDSGKPTIHHAILTTIIESYMSSHYTKKEIIEPMFKGCQELLECEDDTLPEVAKQLIEILPSGMVVSFDKTAAIDLFDKYLTDCDTRSMQLMLNSLDGLFKQTPELVYDKLDTLAALMDGADKRTITTINNFFYNVAVKDAKKFSPKALGHMAATLESEDTSGVVLMTMAAISNACPFAFLPHEDVILKSLFALPSMANSAAGVLINMAKGSKERTEKYLKQLIEVTKHCDKNIKINLLYNMQQLGHEFPEVFRQYEEFYKGYLGDPNYDSFAQSALDLMHGLSLSAVAQDVQEVQDNVEDLDERVTNTDVKVEHLDQKFTTTKVGVASLKKDVTEQNERIDGLEDVIEETVEKVEEIDKKTLSHAPKWSQDVAKIMNGKTEHDWHLLSSKLGYNNDDIRNWATQANPCLSMFDEWFATHKTREATHAILKHLEEMNRMDAAMIVENALKLAEGVAEVEYQDYETPPEVFISYQWGVQNEVKLLKKHLEMAGYESWMDIGQMGGGDKLFEKIDTGIRSAKVILCCVTDKYAKSSNCNREVNLSVNLGKPIIPLLMEKMSWPPAGSMGPIFGEYLFIRFFARRGEESGDNRYWPLSKFQELLMQLRYTAIPNGSIITQPYMDWQSPPEEIIVIKSQEKGNNTEQRKSENYDEYISPDVFISYQWGKQPQIKVLYKKLTSMGYTCWLDIMQMGGGDSLYDKIDKGVRGCKVVVSCVTTKYSLSANCRREVSLADALKKPIVPLLLEKMNWPPEGPMSMMFTQLLYIDFCEPDISVQNKWQCPQMNELLGKINRFLPQVKQEIANLQPHRKDSINQKGSNKLTILNDSKFGNIKQISSSSKEYTDTREKNNRQIIESQTYKQEEKKSSSCIVL